MRGGALLSSRGIGGEGGRVVGRQQQSAFDYIGREADERQRADEAVDAVRSARRARLVAAAEADAMASSLYALERDAGGATVAEGDGSVDPLSSERNASGSAGVAAPRLFAAAHETSGMGVGTAYEEAPGAFATARSGSAATAAPLSLSSASASVSALATSSATSSPMAAAAALLLGSQQQQRRLDSSIPYGNASMDDSSVASAFGDSPAAAAAEGASYGHHSRHPPSSTAASYAPSYVAGRAPTLLARTPPSVFSANRGGDGGRGEASNVALPADRHRRQQHGHREDDSEERPRRSGSILSDPRLYSRRQQQLATASHAALSLFWARAVLGNLPAAASSPADPHSSVRARGGSVAAIDLSIAIADSLGGFFDSATTDVSSTSLRGSTTTATAKATRSSHRRKSSAAAAAKIGRAHV